MPSPSKEHQERRVRVFLRRESQVRLWIGLVLRRPLPCDDLSVALADGIALCQLMLKIQPRSIPVEAIQPFHGRENLALFLTAAEAYGVLGAFCFQLNDLTMKNMPRVVNMLFTLCSEAEANGFPIGMPAPAPLPSPLDLSTYSSSHQAVFRKMLRPRGRAVVPAVRMFGLDLSSVTIAQPPTNSPVHNIRAQARSTPGLTKLQALIRGHLQRKRLRKAAKQRAYRERVVQEILDTEEKYVGSLEDCIRLFLNPLQDASKYEQPRLAALPDLPRSTVRTIFSDMRMIYQFHLESILAVIRPRIEAWDDTKCLGDVFLRIVGMMKIYTQYISNYSNSIATVRSLNTEKAWSDWKDAQESKVNGMSLSSFLIMPIQRLPRYIMLLSDLSKHTNKDHPDLKDLRKAAAEMESVTHFLNAKKKEAENMERMQRLASQLQPLLNINICEPHRRFLREDVFGEQTVYLFNDMVVILQHVAKKSKSKRITKSSRSRSSDDEDGNCTYFYLEDLQVLDVASTYQIRNKATQEILLEGSQLAARVSQQWLAAFGAVHEDALAASGDEGSQSMDCRMLTRFDSVRKLSEEKLLINSHMNALDMQIKVQKSSKEKKRLMFIRQAMSTTAGQVDNQLSQKVAKRRATVTKVQMGKSNSSNSIEESPSSPSMTIRLRRTSVLASQIKC